MSANNNTFAIEQLEERNESFWVLVPYVTWCVRYVWGFPIYYLWNDSVMKQGTL